MIFRSFTTYKVSFLAPKCDSTQTLLMLIVMLKLYLKSFDISITLFQKGVVIIAKCYVMKLFTKMP